jgi:hypothetical protein
MKTALITLLNAISILGYAQNIDYNHFDSKLLEKLVFEELNRYRDSLCVVDLLWSEVMYSQISCKQTEILAQGSRIFHPDLDSLFTEKFRINLAEESQRLTGIRSQFNCGASAVTTLSENIFSWELYNVTYQDMARIAIDSWDKSFMHKCNQKYPYLVDGGGKGFVSISARLNDSKTKIFICCNFSQVHKEKLP